MKYYYRFNESLYTESKLMLVMQIFPVIKTTEKGVWIDNYGIKKFILLNAHKRYACPSEAEALQSYHARKKRQCKILRYQLAKAEAALKLTKPDEVIYIN